MAACARSSFKSYVDMSYVISFPRYCWLGLRPVARRAAVAFELTALASMNGRGQRTASPSVTHRRVLPLAGMAMRAPPPAGRSSALPRAPCPSLSRRPHLGSIVEIHGSRCEVGEMPGVPPSIFDAHELRLNPRSACFGSWPDSAPSDRRPTRCQCRNPGTSPGRGGSSAPAGLVHAHRGLDRRTPNVLIGRQAHFLAAAGISRCGSAT